MADKLRLSCTLRIVHNPSRTYTISHCQHPLDTDGLPRYCSCGRARNEGQALGRRRRSVSWTCSPACSRIPPTTTPVLKHTSRSTRALKCQSSLRHSRRSRGEADSEVTTHKHAETYETEEDQYPEQLVWPPPPTVMAAFPFRPVIADRHPPSDIKEQSIRNDEDHRL